MACALGLADSIVGITHECDYPPEIKSKPVVVRAVLPLETMSQSEIDRAVAERIRNGQSLYEIDEQLLRELAPDLILTQNLCQVCAPSGNEVSQVIKALPKSPQILWLTPQSINEIFDNVRDGLSATMTIEVEDRDRIQPVLDSLTGSIRASRVDAGGSRVRRQHVALQGRAQRDPRRRAVDVLEPSAPLSCG